MSEDEETPWAEARERYLVRPRAPVLDLDDKTHAQVLLRTRSAYQQILLKRQRDGVVVLTLDGYWQFHSDDEHIYHEVLTDTPLVLAPRIERVLILGGGDGFCVRNALRYPEVKRVVLCELDPEMIRMTMELPEMIELTGDSLRDPRVEVIIDDARVFMAETEERFDVVVTDFPASTRPELEMLFSHAFYRQLSRVMHEDTVLSVQVSQSPARFWDVYQNLAQLFPWALPLLVEMGAGPEGEDYWANYVVASARPRRPERALPAGVSHVSLERLPRLVIQNFERTHFETLESPRTLAGVDASDDAA